MTVDNVSRSVFDARLPTLDYDVTATPGQLYPRLLAAQQQAPIALGPFGPEFFFARPRPYRPSRQPLPDRTRPQPRRRRRHLRTPLEQSRQLHPR